MGDGGDPGSRAARERAHYERGLVRGRYEDVLSHAGALATRRRQQQIAAAMRAAEGRDVLELGSQAWVNFLARPGITPRRLCCINISERELARGAAAATHARLRPAFSLMDAMRLGFPDASFDVVFGSSILHHLDLVPALDEVRRVLRPNGWIVFSEPLGVNPLGRVVRWLTPQARTADERPLGSADLAAVRARFDAAFHYEQLVSVPAGLVSRALFADPDNALMRFALRVDEAVAAAVPALGPLFRRVLIVGRRR